MSDRTNSPPVSIENLKSCAYHLDRVLAYTVLCGRMELVPEVTAMRNTIAADIEAHRRARRCAAEARRSADKEQFPHCEE